MELGAVFIFHSFCWPFLNLTTPFQLRYWFQTTP